MFHSFVVLRVKGGEALLTRFYLQDDREKQDAFLQSLRSLDVPDASVQRVAMVGRRPLKTVVSLALSGLAFFLSGVDDYDELVCGEVLRAMVELILEQCEREFGENEFLAQFDRISLLVDHVIRHGIVEHTSQPVLHALVSLTPSTVRPEVLKSELERVSVPAASLSPLHLQTKAKPGATPANVHHQSNRRIESQIVVLNKAKK